MTTRPFSDSRYGHQLAGVAGAARRLSVATFGESHGEASYLGYAIQHAVWRDYHADIHYDHRTYANGGQAFAVGGTTTTGTNGLTTQVGQFQGRPADIAFIASGYNDQPNSTSTAATVANTVIAQAELLFQYGASYVVICGISPRALANSALAWMEYNQRIRNYAAVRPRVFFMDVTTALGDRQNNGSTAPGFRDLGTYPAGQYLSLTAEGTHWSGHACRNLIAPLVADILRRIVGVRSRRIAFNAGDYHPTNKPYCNILGDAGNCMGTSGTVVGMDGGSVAAGTGATSRIAMTKNGTITAATSIETDAMGTRKQRIAPGGTGVASSPFISLQITPTITGVNGGVASRKMNYECMIELTGIVGLRDIDIRPSGGTANRCIIPPGTSDANRWVDGATETLFARTLYDIDVPPGNNPAFQIIFTFANGSNPAGTIDVSRMSAMVVSE